MSNPENNPSDVANNGTALSGNRLDLQIRRLAHDLNNQLTVIHGNTELVQMDTGPNHPALESVLEIKAACTRAREIVRRILDECHRYSDGLSVLASTGSSSMQRTASEEQTGKPGQGKGSQDSRSILLVDDESSFLDLAKRFLERSGHRVTSFLQPDAALKAFELAPDQFDLVITDVCMPGTSGFELARVIRSIRPNMPLVLTSGVVRPEDELQARQIGVRNVVAKPDTIEAFVQIIHELLRP